MSTQRQAVVDMESGRVWWWIRKERRTFEDIDTAVRWVSERIGERKWFRYRISEANGSAMGGGNF